ncbi:Uncharacterised protein [Segatella copri]|nr:Uncharacterised protein [Segatella copri]
MFINILLCVLAGDFQIFLQMVFSRPTPVVWPKMNVAIIYILVGTDPFPTVQFTFTSKFTFATDRNQMILIERTDQLESTRLITYLP